MMTPVRHPDHPARLAQDDLDLARVPAKRSANSIASGRGSTVVRSTIAPSAFDTTFWVTTSTSSGRSGRSSLVRSRAAQSSAGRSSPATTSGTPSRATIWIRPSAVATDQAAPTSSGTRRSTRSRSSGVSTSSESGPSVSSTSRAPLARAFGWAARLSPPKENAIASGGASRSAFVPRPWRSGTMTTSGASPSVRAASSGSTIVAISSGEMSGRSTGRTRIASAPPAIASSRACSRPLVQAAAALADRPAPPADGDRPRPRRIGLTTSGRRRWPALRVVAASVRRQESDRPASRRSSASSDPPEPRLGRPRASRRARSRRAGGGSPWSRRRGPVDRSYATRQSRIERAKARTSRAQPDPRPASSTMSVSVTSVRSPSASTAGASAASTASRTKPVATRPR